MELIVVGWGLVGLIAFFKGIYECKTKKNAYGETLILFPWGIFVWGDAVVIGLFWAATAAVSFVMKDVVLFGLIMSVFWVVRSLGETIYWFIQQFSTINRNPPEKMRGYSLVKNDSIWFVYQISWQCLTVVSVIATIYFGALWLKTMF